MAKTGQDLEDRCTVFVSAPHPKALLGPLRKFVAQMQPLLRAKWVANVLACVVSSAVVNRINFPRKGKRKESKGMLKICKTNIHHPFQSTKLTAIDYLRKFGLQQ